MATTNNVAGKNGNQFTNDARKQILLVLEDVYLALNGPMKTGIGGTEAKKAASALEKAIAMLHRRLRIRNGADRLKRGRGEEGSWSYNKKSRAMHIVMTLDQPLWELTKYYDLGDDELVLCSIVQAAVEHMKDAVSMLWDHEELWLY